MEDHFIMINNSGNLSMMLQIDELYFQSAREEIKIRNGDDEE